MHLMSPGIHSSPQHLYMLPLLQEADMGDGAVEMRFSLPAAASPAMLMLLLAACRELQRAGGFACSSTAVHLMSWELGRAVVAVLRCGHTQPAEVCADLCIEEGSPGAQALCSVSSDCAQSCPPATHTL